MKMPVSLKLPITLMAIFGVGAIAFWLFSLKEGFDPQMKDFANVGMLHVFFFLIALIGILLKEFWGLGVLFGSLVIAISASVVNNGNLTLDFVAFVFLGLVFLYLVRNKELHGYLNKSNGTISCLPFLPNKAIFIRYLFFGYQVVAGVWSIIQKPDVVGLMYFLSIIPMFYVLLIPIHVRQ